jgi:hypothetical protein
MQGGPQMIPTRETVPSNAARKEWRRPVLRKLPIAATANSQGKASAVNNSDGSGMPKSADAHGQFS